jgi:hypothetical protein
MCVFLLRDLGTGTLSHHTLELKEKTILADNNARKAVYFYEKALDVKVMGTFVQDGTG